jgi:RNA polymerase sigma-70 factor (ECF subfamily)
VTRGAEVPAAARPAGLAPLGVDVVPPRRSDDSQLDLGDAFREHRRAIFLYLLRRTGDADRAEDLTQEVFAEAVAALPRLFVDRKPLLPWLYTVARRRAIDAARRDRLVPCGSLEDVSADVAERAPGADLGVVVEAVRTLPATQRAVVLMRLFEGRSFAEIGIALDAAESACRMRFSRAMRALRRSLEQAGFTLLPLLLELGESDFQASFSYI